MSVCIIFFHIEGFFYEFYIVENKKTEILKHYNYLGYLLPAHRLQSSWFY